MARITRTLFGGKRKYAALLLALLVMPSSAMAAWTLTAHGKGKARVGSLAQPTVSPGEPTGVVLPGTKTAAAFEVTNPNGAPVEVTEVADGDGSGSSSVAGAACPAAMLTVESATLATPIAVPANQTVTIQVPDVFKLDPDAPTTCQGVELQRDVQLKFRVR